MKILGYELNLSRTAAEPVKTKKGLEIGDSGTRILGGIVSEDYNSKLQGLRGIEVYDEMRKSDASVKAAISATTLPIRAATWYVEPASDEPQDQEIAEFVEKALMEWQSLEWEDLLRQALLSLPFGFMVFESLPLVAALPFSSRWCGADVHGKSRGHAVCANGALMDPAREQ